MDTPNNQAIQEIEILFQRTLGCYMPIDTSNGYDDYDGPHYEEDYDDIIYRQQEKDDAIQSFIFMLLDEKIIKQKDFINLYKIACSDISKFKDLVIELAKEKYNKIQVIVSEHDYCECGICLEENIMGVISSCKHKFCESCIKEWNKDNDTCPYCRQKLIFEVLIN